jgi:hypothetical protein
MPATQRDHGLRRAGLHVLPIDFPNRSYSSRPSPLRDVRHITSCSSLPSPSPFFASFLNDLLETAPQRQFLPVVSGYREMTASHLSCALNRRQTDTCLPPPDGISFLSNVRVPIERNAWCKTKSPSSWTKAGGYTGVHYCTAYVLQRF